MQYMRPQQDVCVPSLRHFLYQILRTGKLYHCILCHVPTRSHGTTGRRKEIFQLSKSLSLYIMQQGTRQVVGEHEVDGSVHIGGGAEVLPVVTREAAADAVVMVQHARDPVKAEAVEPAHHHGEDTAVGDRRLSTAHLAEIVR